MRKCALPVGDWGITGELKSTPDTNREVADCVVGCVQSDAGEVMEYIVEEMYADILASVQASNKRVFKVNVMIQKIPPVVFRYNHMIVFHNEQIRGHMERIRQALDSIPTDILMQSLIEARIMQYKQSKGDGLRALEKMVLSKSGTDYHPDLIIYIVQQMIHDYDDGTEIGIKDMFREFSLEQIIKFIGAVKEFSLSEETHNENLAGLLDKFDIKQIETAVNREITDRFFLGQI